MIKLSLALVICVQVLCIEAAVPIDIVTEIADNDGPRYPVIVQMIPDKESLIGRTGADVEKETLNTIQDTTTTVTSGDHDCGGDECTVPHGTATVKDAAKKTTQT